MAARGGSPPAQLDLHSRDTEIVVAVFRTVFLLVVLLSPQFAEARGTGGMLLAGAVIAAACYNLFLFVLHVQRKPFPRLIIVAADLVLISLWIYFCGSRCEAFFALYYAVMIVAGLWYGVGGALLTAVTASAMYVWATLAARPDEAGIEPVTVALQIVFLIVCAGVLSIAVRVQDRERQALATSRAVLQQYRERIRAAQYVDDLVRPRRLPVAPGLEVGFQYRPAAVAFSGDYYDLIPLGGRRWGLCVADLSGQFSQRIGYLSTFKTTLRLTARREQSPARLLREINREVAAAAADSGESETFISMAYVIVDLDEGSLAYANAGHEPPAIIRRKGGEAVSLGEGGIVLGVAPEQEYEEERLALQRDDAIVLFTDGMTEATDKRRRFLGREGLLAQVVKEASAPTAQEMAGRVFGYVVEWGREGERRDDMTLVVARVVADDLGAAGEPTLD